jgi:hypothetical protein
MPVNKEAEKLLSIIFLVIPRTESINAVQNKNMEFKTGIKAK